MPALPPTRLVAAAIASAVALVGFRMAWKGLSARRWLPFHERAAGAAWESLPPRQQAVVLFAVRMVGLGFLVLALVLAGGVALVVRGGGRAGPVGAFAVGAASALGTGVFAHRLHHETGATTPWRGAFGAALALAVAAMLALGPP
jgi:hypothetical protein